jgi:hypothetical protein
MYLRLLLWRATLKAQLDGAWLGSFYVMTDVTDKESHSNAPCIRPGAARDWASKAHWIAAEATFSRSSKGLGAGSCCGYTGLAVYAPSQSRPSLYTLRSGLCFLVSGCASRTYPSKAAGPPFAELVASCSQIVFSVPICWPSKWRHVTRRATRRLV